MIKLIKGYFIYRITDKKEFTTKINTSLKALTEKSKLSAAYPNDEFMIGKFIVENNKPEEKVF